MPSVRGRRLFWRARSSPSPSPRCDPRAPPRAPPPPAFVVSPVPRRDSSRISPAPSRPRRSSACRSSPPANQAGSQAQRGCEREGVGEFRFKNPGAPQGRCPAPWRPVPSYRRSPTGWHSVARCWLLVPRFVLGSPAGNQNGMSSLWPRPSTVHARCCL